MAVCLNRTEIIGNVGREPRLMTDNNRPRFKFSVAVNQVYKRNGEVKEETIWYSCTAWGNQATIYAKMLHQGDFVFVSGSMKNFNWQNQRTGEQHHEMTMDVSQVVKLAQGSKIVGATQTFEGQETSTEAATAEPEEESLPF